MMSSTGLQKRTLVAAARHLWAIGGIHTYYRGLSVRPSYHVEIQTYQEPCRLG
jgi:hypothetical protein